MEAKEAIQRLCELQKNVREHLGFNDAADCFCGESGFWKTEGYDGTFDGGYRNDGKAIKFIEEAVREKILVLESSNNLITGATDDQ